MSCLNFWDEACWFLSLRLKHCGNNNKDEDNSQKNLYDKNWDVVLCTLFTFFGLLSSSLLLCLT